ncbi:flagellar export chaperone FlgN [Aeromonas rivipollensis]
MSMAPKLRVKELIIGIQQDCGRYADLQQLLLNQHSLLASHDVDGLTEHNRQQTRLMADIQQQAQQRCQHLLALGLKPDEQGMATLITRLPTRCNSALASNGRRSNCYCGSAGARTNSTDACWPARSKRSTPCWARSHPMAGRNTSPIESSAPLQGAMTQAGEFVQLPLLP